MLKEDEKKALEMFERVVAMEADFEWQAKAKLDKIMNINNN